MWYTVCPHGDAIVSVFFCCGSDAYGSARFQSRRVCCEPHPQGASGAAFLHLCWNEFLCFASCSGIACLLTRCLPMCRAKFLCFVDCSGVAWLSARLRCFASVPSQVFLFRRLFRRCLAIGETHMLCICAEPSFFVSSIVQALPGHWRE